ncbi:MAG: hypothetical protein MUP47_10590 [Phycisphaerae bacterium]|nr:hypothetical protein [Phycisphaerae bacterium]
MRTLVLDKSALVGTPPGFLARQGFTFLLTLNLFHEIVSERIDKRKKISKLEQEKLDQRVRSILHKAIREAGNVWLNETDAVEFEITRGRSAKDTPRITLPPGVIDVLPGETQQVCIGLDAIFGEQIAAIHASGGQTALAGLRLLGEEAFFQSIRAQSSSPQTQAQLAREAKIGFAESAERRGLSVSPLFCPASGWLTFGVNLVQWAYSWYRLWKWGKDPPGKPANVFCDAIYVAHVSITDGILSSDEDLLKLAWACWPEKEDDIYEFDQQSQTRRRFHPRWSR